MGYEGVECSPHRLLRMTVDNMEEHALFDEQGAKTMLTERRVALEEIACQLVAAPDHLQILALKLFLLACCNVFRASQTLCLAGRR